MAAKVYHFCQHERKTLYLPSTNNYKSLAVGTVLTECPSCGKPIKPVTVSSNHEGYIKRTGWRMKLGGGNYKKKQQAKAKWNNATPSFDQRMQRMGLPRR